MEMTMAMAREDAAKITDAAVRTAWPGASDRIQTLEKLAYASRQIGRHARSDRFGPQHPLTQAYQELANGLSATLYEETERLLEKNL